MGLVLNLYAMLLYCSSLWFDSIYEKICCMFFDCSSTGRKRLSYFAIYLAQYVVVIRRKYHWNIVQDALRHLGNLNLNTVTFTHIL